MKKLLSFVTIIALLVPHAGTYAQNESEEVAEQKKELSSWTGNFLSSVGRAIRKRDYKKLPEIVAKYKKTATGLGLLIVGAIAVIVRVFAPREEQPIVRPAFKFPYRGQAEVGQEGALDIEARERRAQAQAEAARREERLRGQRRAGAGAGVGAKADLGYATRMTPSEPVTFEEEEEVSSMEEVD